MPSLDFKGKSFVASHHLGVPIRELLVKPDQSWPLPAAGGRPDLDDNLIIRGDNLEALKALLPRYAGQVDCIYIDPPYNTGAEGWCYNDAVNAPLMREWLKKAATPVEHDDLQRHDKWLCMMWPRLQLLKELLAEGGTIFISIDDHEAAALQLLMDEIFGSERFIASLVWKSRQYPDARAKSGVSTDHEYILVYGKNEGVRLRGGERDAAKYTNPDEDSRGDWMSRTMLGLATKEDRPNLHYPIFDPRDQRRFDPPAETGWRYEPATMHRKIQEGRIMFPREPDGRPREKVFLQELQTTFPGLPSIISDIHTAEGTNEIQSIIGPGVFAFPKPSRLIQFLIEQVTNDQALILDSFAGSGTTAHAVLAQNQKDGGNRRFILIQIEEEFAPGSAGYAQGFREVADVTAERVRRVIDGYEYQGDHEVELQPPRKITWATLKKSREIVDRIQDLENRERAHYDQIEKKVENGMLTVVGRKTVTQRMPGVGGSFTFVELGERMDLDCLLAEIPGGLPSFVTLARYLFHTATGRALPPGADALLPGDAPVLLGESAVWSIYLLYRPDEAWLRSPVAALTRAQAEALAAARDNASRGKQVLVFAAAKYISHRSLGELGVEFAQLPYALHRVPPG